MTFEKTRTKKQYISKNNASIAHESPLLLSPIKIKTLDVPSGKLEYCDGNAWYSLASESWVTATIPSLAVTSVVISGSTGLTVSGSPVTNSGAIALTLASELQALSGLNTTGLVARKGVSLYAPVTITGTAGQVNVTNGNGVSGNPVLSLPSTGVMAGSYTNISATVDAYGRLTSISNGNNGMVILSGDVTGSGQNSIATTLSSQINKSGNQVFNFSGTATSFNYDLTIPNSSNKTVKLRFNRANTNLGAGYEFQFSSLATGVDTFTFGYNSGSQFGSYFSVANNAKVITFNSFRLTGLTTPTDTTDAVTKGYVDTKTFDINAATTGQLNISRLSGYPSSASVFLRGDGTWATTILDINATTTGQLNISRLSGYPSSASVFLRGDGTWAIPALKGDTLASYSTSSISVQNPLSFMNLSSNPIVVTTNSSKSTIVLNNTNFEATNTGLSIQGLGGNSVEFGYNNSTGEGYVWGYAGTSIKFGTNNTKRIQLLNDGTLDMMNNPIMNSTFINCTFDINSNTSGQLDITRLKGYPTNSSFFLKGDGTWNYLASNGPYSLSSGVGAFPDHIVLVNSLGKVGAGLYSAVCYGNSGQAAVEFYYSSVLKSYINSSGTLTTSSDRELKSSLRKKDIFQKNYLQRILDLDVYSYTWKNQESEEHDAHHVQVGLLYEDVKRLFNGNALSHPKAREEFTCQDPQCPTCHSSIQGIKPIEIFWYFILAFQSFYHKEYIPLSTRLAALEQKIKAIH